MRTRREKLTAQQLLTRNVSERIVDKDNHARDAMKYLVMSLPEPAMMTARDRVREIVTPLAESGDLTSAYIRYLQHTDEEPYEPARFVSRRSMMFRRR
jgi:methyl coenzyme M reductase gamma subunit